MPIDEHWDDDGERLPYNDYASIDWLQDRSLIQQDSTLDTTSLGN